MTRHAKLSTGVAMLAAGLRVWLWVLTPALVWGEELPLQRIAPLKTPWVYFTSGDYLSLGCYSTDEAFVEAFLAYTASLGAVCEAWQLGWGSEWPVEQSVSTPLYDPRSCPPWPAFAPWEAIMGRRAGTRYEGRWLEYALSLEGNRCQWNQVRYLWGVNRQRYYYCPASYQPDWSQYPFILPCYRTAGPIPEKQPRACPGVGNPIQVATGNKYQVESDYQGQGPLPLRFERHYNSDAAVLSTDLGRQWRHTYDSSVALNSAAGLTTAVVYQADGRAVFFNQTASGTWRADPDVTSRLEQVYDAATQPVGWRYTDEEDQVWVYDGAGKLVSLGNRAGLTQTLAYGPEGRVQTVTDPFGRTLTFRYDAQGRLEILTDPAGQVYTYRYDTQGNLAVVSYPDDTPANPADNPTRIYHYEDTRFAHHLTGISDETGQRFATWAYDAQGRAILSEHAGGAGRVQVTYHADGTTTVTDALGASRRFSFELHHGVLKPARLTGGPCSGCGLRGQTLTYDANGFRASETDFNGHLTTYSHDPRGLQTRRSEAVGTPEERTLTTDWHPTFRLPVRIEEPGRTITLSYDAQGNLLQRTETATDTGAPRTWHYRYNAAGQLIDSDGPRTDVADLTTYSYNAQGNLAQVTNALGRLTQLTQYDAHGRPLTLLDPNGVTTTLSYDARGRLLSRTSAGATTAFQYDGAGNLTRLTLPDGAFLAYTYDAAQRLIEVADNLGNRIAYTLDALGNRTQEEVYDPQQQLTRTRRQVYDNLNRLSEVLGNHGQSTTYGYDANGNLVSTTDALARRTASAFDALDRLVQVTDALQGQTDYAYDGQDRLTAVTDPTGLTTRYTYDGLGDRVSQVSPDTGTSTYTYDTAGNRLSQTDARGVTTTYAYDALNRLIAITYPDSRLTVTFSYDQGSHGIGRLTGMSDSSGTSAYRYDARGNRLSDTHTRAGVTTTLQYTYDAADRLTGITYPSGLVVSYARDSAGRIQQVSASGSGLSATLASQITYQPFGPLAGLTYGNELTLTRRYDQDARLTEQSVGSVQALRFEYDLANNLTALLDSQTASRSQQFGYDALDRLTQAQGPYGSLIYSYDTVGNRLTLTEPGQITQYHYEAASHRLLASDGAQPRTFAYDPNGNTTQAGAMLLSYADHNRLVQAQAGSTTARYTYDGLGQRVQKSLNGQTSSFAYDPHGRLLAETDAQGQPQREYVYLDDQLLALLSRTSAPAPRPQDLNADGCVDLQDVQQVLAARNSPASGPADPRDLDHDGQITALDARRLVLACDRPGCAACPAPAPAAGATWQVLYVHPDHLGTPQVLTDAQQQVVWQAQYRPFGETTLTSAQVTNPLRFPGQYFDAETGLHYNYFRYYDPAIGRYIQSDPIGLRGGLNTYSYVYQNPLHFTDPTGEYGNLALGAAIRVIGGRAAGAAVARELGRLIGPATGTILACVLTAYCSAESNDPTQPKLPQLGGTWEEELEYADKGPKDEAYLCKNDDEYCKKKLLLLGHMYRLIKLKEAAGLSTFVDKTVFDIEVSKYHQECPYWIRLDKFFEG